MGDGAGAHDPEAEVRARRLMPVASHAVSPTRGFLVSVPTPRAARIVAYASSSRATPTAAVHGSVRSGLRPDPFVFFLLFLAVV